LTPAVFYKTVMSDLSDLADVYYDILAFLVQPTQTKRTESRFEAPHKEALDNLRIDILAPNAPSMTMALENTFLKLIKK
jgi:uroporphyrinogen-III synthase